MDIAAQAYVDLTEKSEYRGADEITPFIEYAIAANWNLTLVVTNADGDIMRDLLPLIEHPASIMRVT
jgi:hypothetical protein